MKKNILTIIYMLVAMTCSCAGCSKNISSDNSLDSNDNLVLPGEDRVWWYESFDDLDGTKDFILNLKKSGKNGAFSFGISNFKVPNLYEHFSTTFSGHIDNGASHKEDIFTSVYDNFWIKNMFSENGNDLPNYNRFSIFFLPLSFIK